MGFVELSECALDMKAIRYEGDEVCRAQEGVLHRPRWGEEV